MAAVRGQSIPTELVRDFARRQPSIPTGRVQVVVGKETVIYGLARLFQLCGENVGHPFEVVHSLKEAYNLVGERPEDFTERLYAKDLAAGAGAPPTAPTQRRASQLTIGRPS